MIEEGEPAPSFALPAVRDDEIQQVATSECFGDQLVVLAFYPGDFNPACSDAETGLDDLDLFTMQKDVTVLAVSGDSVYSHRAFAAEYNLTMPLLADVDGTVAEAYGVRVDDESAGYLTRRAVVVVDHTETVQYAWQAEQSRHLPDVDAIRQAIAGIGDDETAQSRYRVGHAHYIEGRRAFTSAMAAYEDHEWMMAQSDFDRAAEEFDEAGEEFDTAHRFAEDADHRTYYERAERKAEALWRAADWLRDSASAFASGEGARAESLRSDAEAPLETARDLHEPVAPDEFPPDEDPAAPDESGPGHFVPDDGEETDASLDADFDDRLDDGSRSGDEQSDAGSTRPGSGDSGVADDPGSQSGRTGQEADRSPVETADRGGSGAGDPGSEATREPAGIDRPAAGTADDESGVQIDEEELEEITAELEEQSEAPADDSESGDASDEGRAESADATDEDSTESVDASEEEPVDLDLTDPDDEDSGGDHGVPDSL